MSQVLLCVGAVSGGCFNLAAVRGQVGACIHLDLGYCLGCRLGRRSSLLDGMTAVTKESKNNHCIGSATGHVIVVGSHGAGAVSGGCFNPAVVRGLEVACIHVDLCYCLGGRLRCSSSLLVGMKAVTKESKNNHFTGMEVARIHLDLGDVPGGRAIPSQTPRVLFRAGSVM